MYFLNLEAFNLQWMDFIVCHFVDMQMAIECNFLNLFRSLRVITFS